MTRRAAIDPEVARGVDDPCAKVVVPETIDDHAGRERIARRHDPVRQPAATLGLGGVGGQLPRRPKLREAAGQHLVAGLGRITTKKPVGRNGLHEPAGIGLGKRGQGVESLAQCRDVDRERFELGQLVGREFGRRRDRSGSLSMHVVAGEAIGMRRNRLPIDSVKRHGDFVLRGQAVGIFGLRTAIATPHDATHLFHFGQLELHPAAADLVGDPRLLVAILAVVDVGELVVGVLVVVARRRRLRTAGDVAAIDREHFQFVDTGLGGRGGPHREADELGRDGSKCVDVFPGRHAAAEVWHGRGRAGGLLLLFKEHRVGRHGSRGLAGDEQQSRRLGEPMHAGIVETAPQRLIGYRLP